MAWMVCEGVLGQRMASVCMGDHHKLCAVVGSLVKALKGP